MFVKRLCIFSVIGSGNLECENSPQEIIGCESLEGLTIPRSSIFLVAFANSPWLSKLAPVADWSNVFMTTK